MKRRIAIVASHPIQYHAHWYRELALCPEIDLEVLYCHRPTPEDQAEAGFGVNFEWDIPLLEGYRYRFLRNVSRHPGVTTFAGIDCPEVREVVIHERYDAVVVSGWHTWGYWQTIRACRESGTPVMVRSDSHLHDDRPRWMRALKYLPYRYFISRMDACLAAGVWSREYFLHYGARPERIFIVPHCVPPRQYNLTSESDVRELRSAWRRRWGIAENSTVFLFAGKLIDRKRPRDFLRAAAAAFAQRTDVHALVAGDGPLRAELESFAAELKLPVTFAGFLNQSAIINAWAAADVLVLPSQQDTWGLVVNEAMSWGRACVVSDRVGCWPDLIGQERTGFVFPCGDVDALAAVLSRIASTPGLAQAMGQNAERLIARHSPHAAARELIAAVTAIMEVG